MKAEEAVQIDHRIAWDVDRRPHRIISLLTMRHHDIEAVGRAPLEDDYKTFFFGPGSICAENAARVKKVGIAAVPTTARAPLRRKIRLVMDIEQLLAFSCSLPADS